MRKSSRSGSWVEELSEIKADGAASRREEQRGRRPTGSRYLREVSRLDAAIYRARLGLIDWRTHAGPRPLPPGFYEGERFRKEKCLGTPSLGPPAAQTRYINRKYLIKCFPLKGTLPSDSKPFPLKCHPFLCPRFAGVERRWDRIGQD